MTVLLLLPIQAGIASSNKYQLVIMSTTDPGNFAVSAGFFSINGQENTYMWVADEWGPCSRICGPDGTRTRAIYCKIRQSAEIVVASQCNAVYAPPSTEACNRINCQATCPGVDFCAGPGACTSCTCLPQSDKKGFFCGGQVAATVYPVPPGPVVGTTFGCDVAGSSYQQCCRDQG
jgi:hypothetical protein